MVNLAVVLIWRFGELNVDRQIKVSGRCNVIAVVATPETPNVMLAKLPRYTVLTFSEMVCINLFQEWGGEVWVCDGTEEKDWGAGQNGGSAGEGERWVPCQIFPFWFHPFTRSGGTPELAVQEHSTYSTLHTNQVPYHYLYIVVPTMLYYHAVFFVVLSCRLLVHSYWT